jgi:hypothetical protein
MVFAPDIDAAASQAYESKGGFFSGGKRTNKKFYEDLSRGRKTQEREKALEIPGELSALERFKKSQQITDTNPYGRDGFMTRVFGISPSNVDYSKRIPSQGIQDIINTKYRQFLDPFVSGTSGALKRGVREGQTTGFGKAKSVPKQQSGKEVLARALFSSASPLGLPLSFLDTKERMISDSPEYTQRVSEGPQGIMGYVNKAVSPLLGGADVPQGIETLTSAFKNILNLTGRGGPEEVPTDRPSFIMNPARDNPVVDETSIIPLNAFENMDIAFQTRDMLPSILEFEALRRLV